MTSKRRKTEALFIVHPMDDKNVDPVIMHNVAISDFLHIIYIVKLYIDKSTVSKAYLPARKRNRMEDPYRNPVAENWSV